MEKNWIRLFTVADVSGGCKRVQYLCPRFQSAMKTPRRQLHIQYPNVSSINYQNLIENKIINKKHKIVFRRWIFV